MILILLLLRPFSIGNHSDSSMYVADLGVLLIVINRLAVSKDQKSHSLSLMCTDGDHTLDHLDSTLRLCPKSQQTTHFDIEGLQHLLLL